MSNVFITEVSVSDPNPPGCVGPAQHVAAGNTTGALAQVNPNRYLVQNIYDFPSVQTIKIENGQNQPFRYKMKEPGRAPVWRSQQGKKLTQQSRKMCTHQAIFSGAPEQMDRVHMERSQRTHNVLPLVARPDAQQGMGRAGHATTAAAAAPVADCTSVTPEPSHASSYSRRGMGQSVSVVGSTTRSGSRASRDPGLPGGADGGGGATVSADTPDGGSGAAPLVLPPTQRLSRARVAGIRARSGIEVASAVPASDAPAPVPRSPAPSVAASHLSDYDNLTSVSLRTPQSASQSQASLCSSHLRKGINQLAQNLREETHQKADVKKELARLKQRQTALMNALTVQQRGALEEKLKELECGGST